MIVPMSQFIFATSNDRKELIARAVCEKAGIDFERKSVDLVEIQSDKAEEIALDKVRQVFQEFNQAVVVTDDSWIIPGLNGFPGPYMKNISQWFTPQDFINLTQGLEDRRVAMRQVIAYKDKDNENVFAADIQGLLLKEIRGTSDIAHFPIISFDGGKTSMAEDESTRLAAISQADNAWHQLCDWLKQM